MAVAARLDVLASVLGTKCIDNLHTTNFWRQRVCRIFQLLKSVSDGREIISVDPKLSDQVVSHGHGAPLRKLDCSLLSPFDRYVR